MLPQSASVPQAARIGVGIDTSRYGHYVCFLKGDLQPAAAELQFAESAAGYAQLRQRLEQIAQHHGGVQFVIRLDAAGQYADNLLHCLQTLPTPGADATGLANATVTISCGDPQRNKNYRAALLGGKKSDPVEARACARFALSERPASVMPMSLELRTLRQVAGRLQAVGHAMRKLLHLVFAIWKTRKPFDPEHYPWQAPAHVAEEAGVRNQESAGEVSDIPMSAKEPAAGHNPVAPEKQVVTAAGSITSTPGYLDFAHLKRQPPMARVLDQLGLSPRLKGSGPQKRGPCPLHRGDGRGRTFSVHLGANVFHCHDAACGKKGDVIDLWAGVKGMSLRDAALDLVQTFGLQPAPQ